MKKLLSLLIVALLVALPVCAEEEAPAEGGWLEAEGAEEEMDIYMLQGAILEMDEASMLINDAAQGEVLVLIGEETCWKRAMTWPWATTYTWTTTA